MRHKQVRGFTLIELLVALAAMAIMAGLSWRGLDGMVRAQAQTLLNRINTAARRPGLSAEAQAHVQDSADTLQQALTAKLSRVGA